MILAFPIHEVPDMPTDLNRKKNRIPVIPSASTLRKRLAEIHRDAKKLEAILQLAEQMESIDREESEGARKCQSC